MIVIGISGFARAGKDTFCNIALEILHANGIRAKQYSFAGALKEEVKDFLRKTCGVDVYTQDTEIKKDIRDFLVWYGTTFWRKRDPKRWIRGVDNQIRLDGNTVEIALVSDVRYPNEGEWVHSCAGYLVHVAAYKLEEDLVSMVENGQITDMKPERKKIYFEAPNEQEKINDPIVQNQSDFNLEWRVMGLSPEEAVKNQELQHKVLKALNSCDYFNDPLTLKELHPEKS